MNKKWDSRLNDLPKNKVIEIGKNYVKEMSLISADEFVRDDLPSSVIELANKLAERTHDAWARGKVHDGYVFEPGLDKHHDDLVPYAYLSEQEKSYDYNTNLSVVTWLYENGYLNL